MSAVVVCVALVCIWIAFAVLAHIIGKRADAALHQDEYDRVFEEWRRRNNP